MKSQIITLLAITDRLMAHVGQIKRGDESTPATHWVPTLNELIDLRGILMKERDATLSIPAATTVTKNPSCQPK